MPMTSGAMTASDLIQKLQNIEGGADLPVKIANYEGEHGYTAYTVRKNVITDEEGTVTDAYIVING